MKMSYDAQRKEQEERKKEQKELLINYSHQSYSATQLPHAQLDSTRVENKEHSLCFVEEPFAIKSVINGKVNGAEEAGTEQEGLHEYKDSCLLSEEREVNRFNINAINEHRKSEEKSNVTVARVNNNCNGNVHNSCNNNVNSWKMKEEVINTHSEPLHPVCRKRSREEHELSSSNSSCNSLSESLIKSERRFFRQEDLHDSDFRKEEVLGHGSYSVVTLATHVPSKRIVALKQISRHKLHVMHLEQQLKWEINVHRTLRHPHIVRLLSYYVTAHSINLILEYCSAGTLMSRLRRTSRGFLKERTAARYTRHIARALCYLHKHGIVHRDLKLENVLLDEHDIAKLADFGWSRVLSISVSSAASERQENRQHEENNENTTLCYNNKNFTTNNNNGDGVNEKISNTATTAELCDECGSVEHSKEVNQRECSTGRLTVCGTLDYLSPEMVAGKPYTAKTDVWSLGVMIAEMLMGNPPFYRTTHAATLDAILHASPKLMRSHTSRELNMILEEDNKKLKESNYINNNHENNNSNTEKLHECTSTMYNNSKSIDNHVEININEMCIANEVIQRANTDALIETNNLNDNHILQSAQKHLQMSAIAFNLIKKMLDKNPDKRPTMEEILRHPWLQKQTQASLV